jgi:hypothetical protein
MNPKFVLLTLSFFLVTVLSAQPKNFTQIEDADEHFDNGNYLFAIQAYQSELKKDPDNLKAKFRLGICYLNTRISREEAVPYLEECSRHPRAEPEVWFYLGRAYHLATRIDEAKAAYEKFIGLRPKESDDARRYLEQCHNAEKLMQHPANVTLQNLGKDINSEEPDYNPFINRNETYLVFTSRRRENIGGKKIEVDGYRSSDIYQSVMDQGSWQPARNAGRGVNTNLDEQVVGLRSDGLEMYMYIDHIDKFGDIYVTTRKDESSEFTRPKIFEGPVNGKIETSGCVSDEGSPLFFARREGVNGNSDLYMSRILPGNQWAMPIRLPDNINTKYNEDLPFLSQDSKYLYFTSEGHNSMGGYDLFRAKWDRENNNFSDPENLGYPINSTDDDRSICVTADNRLAYISAYRPNGIGDLDIYRVKFNNVAPVIAIYTGKVYMGDTVTAHQPKNYALNIIVTSKQGDEYTYAPHPRTGRFVMALPAGEYTLTLATKGYQKLREEFTVTDMGQVNDVRQKDLLLKKEKKATEKKPPGTKPHK